MKIISIIIATFNAEKTLDKCLNSIESQINEKIELIIIDGSSKDKTICIINNHKNIIEYFISEPDSGVYEAWNKGIQKSQGDWIMFLGADDLLLSGALDAYLDFIEKNGDEFDIISSKLDYVNINGTHLKYVGEPWDWHKFVLSSLSFAHPGLLHNAKLFITNGSFDTTFKICADSEFFLRTKGEIKAGFLDFFTVKMQQGGISYSVKAVVEAYQIRKKNNPLSPTRNYIRFFRTLTFFYLSKIKQLKK